MGGGGGGGAYLPRLDARCFDYGRWHRAIGGGSQTAVRLIWARPAVGILTTGERSAMGPLAPHRSFRLMFVCPMPRS